MAAMAILAVDENLVALKELTENLQATFPQDTITAFKDPLFALQYAYNHPKEIRLVFSAIAMRHADGLELAKAIQKTSPGAITFFTVETDSWELAAIARQYGGGVCIKKPVTVEKLQEATCFLY